MLVSVLCVLSFPVKLTEQQMGVDGSDCGLPGHLLNLNVHIRLSKQCVVVTVMTYISPLTLEQQQCEPFLVITSCPFHLVAQYKLLICIHEATEALNQLFIQIWIPLIQTNLRLTACL